MWESGGKVRRGRYHLPVHAAMGAGFRPDEGIGPYGGNRKQGAWDERVFRAAGVPGGFRTRPYDRKVAGES